MSNTEKITLIVVEAESPTGDRSGLPQESFQQQSIKDIKKKFGSKSKKVELSKLTDRMAEVQDEVDKLLANLKRPRAGYRLSEVQVSLAISGNGSIGIATVGAEATIALTFAPSKTQGTT